MDIFLKEGPGSFVTIWMHNEHEKNKKIPSWLSNVWYAFTCFHFSYGGILKWKCTTQVNFNGPIGSGWKATLKGAAAGLLSDGLFKIKLDFFGGSKGLVKKTFNWKRGWSSSFFYIFRIHFYAGIVMVEYKEICGSTSTICKVVKKEKEVMKKKERDMTTNCKIISFCSVGPTLQSLGTFFFGYTTWCMRTTRSPSLFAQIPNLRFSSA